MSATDTPRTEAEWTKATANHEAMVVKEANARIRIAQLERELAKVREALAEQLDTYNDQQKQLENARKAYSSLEAESQLEREALAMIHSPASGVWLWQGDGADHPESMANQMPVVMTGETLRGMQSQLTTQRTALEKAMEAFCQTNPWSILAVLAKLSEAADILLIEKDYDGHGWESIQHAQQAYRNAIPSIAEALTTINAALEEKK